jgi:arylsulfatase A-like enzyme
MYAAIVEGMDKSLGDILANLKRHGLTDNTVFLFMSDNGGLSAHGRGGTANTHNKPLSSGKGSAHEGGVRVPMIVDWPGVTKSGSVCHFPVIIEDFFPTILDIAGVGPVEQIGGKIDGRSFAPLLKGHTQLNPDRSFFWHYPNNWGPGGPGIGATSTIRKGGWKLIYYHDPGRKVRYELFNLIDDLGETKNLALENPGIRSKLARELANYLREAAATMPIIKASGQSVPLPE